MHLDSRGGQAAPRSRKPIRSWAVLRIATAAVVMFFLPACYTVGPDYVPPEPDVPDAWQEVVADGLVEGHANLHRWWVLLDDPVLNDLVQQAGSGNLTLQVAFARIQEAQAQRGVTSGELYPTVTGRADLQRGRTSQNGQFGALIPDRTSKLYTTGLDASWEIDLWGRIRRAIESADAEVEASVENYRDLLVSLLAETAATYVQVRALQARIEAAESNARNQRGTLKLTEDRFKAGLAPALDVSQARLNLATSESTIPTLEIALHNSINRLAVLLGEYPGAVNERLASTAPVPEPPEQVAVGLPTDLLRQRPDLRQAERQLAAQTARIGVAAADLYPSFSLSGTFGLESISSRKLLRSDSATWTVAPAVRWNLFNGGRVRSGIQVEDARTRQALVTYENTVILAVEDVENAMIAFKREQTRRAALDRAVNAAEESVKLVKDLYKTGMTDFQNVLDSERSLFNLQDQQAESRGLVTQNLINLYRALGGGWDPDARPPESTNPEPARPKP